MKHLTALMILLSSIQGIAQTNNEKYPHRLLTIEPGIGVHTNMGTDLLLTTMVQWNPKRKLALAGHTFYSINNITAREVNHVVTDFNYSLSQRLGVGTTLYARKSSHSFFFMAGINYTAYQETLKNPNLDPAYQDISVVISSLSPDYGIMYSLKKGGKKCFFTFRAYIPLYPWPMKGSDINYADANMNTISLEFGVGIKIK